jgi:WD40 repeat protein
VYELPSGKKRLRNLVHTNDIRLIHFAPSGTLVAISAGRTVYLWDAATGELVRRFRAFRADVLSLTFSPDGRLLFAGAKEGRVRVWEVSSGRELADLDWKAGPVNTLVRESDSPSRSMLSTVARIWQNSSVAPSVSTIATLPVVGSVGLDVSDESPSPPQAANVTNAAAVMLSRATRSNEMLLETDIVPSLMMSPYDMMNPYDCEPESTNSDTFRYLSPDM